MSTLAWIILGGVAMSAIALVGGFAALLPERVLDRILLPIVGLAAGSLLGGALFHMLPSAVDALGNSLTVYVWVVAGFVSFFVLEQALHWHHCHFRRDGRIAVGRVGHPVRCHLDQLNEQACPSMDRGAEDHQRHMV